MKIDSGKLFGGEYCGIDYKKCGRIKTLEQELARLRKALKKITRIGVPCENECGVIATEALEG